MSTTNEKSEQRSDEAQLPNSRKIYVEGRHAGVRVPFREITQNVTKNFNGTLEENRAVRVYDTSGPWDDPAVRCDVREGLAALRRDWIIARDDTEEYEGRTVKPADNGYLTAGAEQYAKKKEKKGRLEEFKGLRRAPLRARAGRRVTQMHYARRGIITPEMEFVAIRENLGREAAFRAEGNAERDSLSHQHRGESFNASIPSYVTPEFVRERLFKPFQTTKKAGMGIGVYESVQYISGLGGKILVDSTVQVGTRVRVLLPLGDSATAPSAPLKEVA